MALQLSAIGANLSYYGAAFILPSGVDYLSQKAFKKYVGFNTSIIPAVLSMWGISKYLSQEANACMAATYVVYKILFRIPGYSQVELESACETLEAWEFLSVKIGIPQNFQNLGNHKKIEKAKEFEQWLEKDEIKTLLSRIEELKLPEKSYKYLDMSIFLCKLTHIKNLGIGSNLLIVFPHAILQLRDLIELDLSFNRFRSLPKEITQLSNLRKLDVSHNRLTQLPEEIAQLQNLKSLDVSSNELTSLPEIIGSMLLQELHCSGNRFGGSLTQMIFPLCLIKLSLDSTDIEYLPIDVCRLPRLASLTVSSCALQTLPSEISQLHELQLINLSGNRLEAIPPEIFQLTCLRILNLSSNNISTIPPDIGNLSRLEILFLSHNQLTVLPNQFQNLHHLDDLYLYRNHLQGLPETLQHLPRSCTIHAGENLFSPEMALTLQNQFQSARLRPGSLEGPRLSISIRDAPGNLQLEGSLETEIRFWLELTRETKEISFYAILLNHEYKGILHEFLTRLKLTQDFKGGGSSRENVIVRAVRMLDQAAVDERFRKVMFGVLQGGTQTCSQRIEFVFDDIEVEWHLSQAGSLTEVKLAKALIGKRRRILLRDIAESRAEQLGFGDILAVVQFYQVELRKRLELPISTNDLSYRNMAVAVSPYLEPDAIQVLNQTTSSEQIAEILLKEPLWIKKLEEKYASDLEKITAPLQLELANVDELPILAGEKAKKMELVGEKQKRLAAKYLAVKNRKWIQDLHAQLIEGLKL